MRYALPLLLCAMSCSSPIDRLDRITADAKAMRPISAEDMLWLRGEAGLDYAPDPLWQDPAALAHAQLVILMLCQEARRKDR